MKRCRTCGRTKPKAQFHKDRSHKDGLRGDCKLCVSFKHSKRYERLKDKIKKQAAEYRDRNRTLIRYKARRYRAANRERLHLLRLAFKVLGRESAGERRARLIRRATPKWANPEYIKLWYSICHLETLRTGHRCHVDHIVPLVSPLVCGLHTEDNLQVLFWEDNLAKGNRYWPDMP